MRSLLAALRCLTILPIGSGLAESEPVVARSRLWYPPVGVAIGLVIGSVGAGLRCVFADEQIAAALAVLVGVLITGGLHLDGLADSFDGLFARGDRERRLEIMRDPHVGSFGVTAIVLCLLIKTLAISALATGSVLVAIMIASVAGRGAILIVAGLSPYARRDGTGRIVIDAAGPADCVWALIWVVGVGVAAAGYSAAIPTLAAAFVAVCWAGLCRWRIGGATGDCLGAVTELAETASLLAAAAVSIVPTGSVSELLWRTG